MNKKKILIKIIVPVLIAVTLTAVWRLKTHPTPTSFENKDGSGPLVTAKNDGDFALETSAVDLKALTSYGLPIIIDFGADSCEPCKAMAPVLKKMNAEMQGKAIIKFVDVWKNGAAAKDFPIQVIPTQVFIKADGTPYVPGNEIGIGFTMYSTRDTNKHVFTVHQGGLTEDQMRLILADMGVAQ